MMNLSKWRQGRYSLDGFNEEFCLQTQRTTAKQGLESKPSLLGPVIDTQLDIFAPIRITAFSVQNTAHELEICLGAHIWYIWYAGISALNIVAGSFLHRQKYITIHQRWFDRFEEITELWHLESLKQHQATAWSLYNGQHSPGGLFWWSAWNQKASEKKKAGSFSQYI